MSKRRRFLPCIGWVVFAAAGLAAIHSHALARSGRNAAPVKVLIITGDHGHAWKDTTALLADALTAGDKIKVDVTISPSQ